jgi:hypothetical protein
MKTLKGKFKPRNPSKYKGDPTNIIYRSSWEAKFMKYLDEHQDVINWMSEEIIVPYRSPVDGKLHRYFPDFLIRKRNVDGVVETVMVEIKPASQTVEPVKKKTINKAYINEVMTWGVNQAKWKAASEFCADRKWRFLIMTEKELGIKW